MVIEVTRRNIGLSTPLSARNTEVVMHTYLPFVWSSTRHAKFHCQIGVLCFTSDIWLESPSTAQEYRLYTVVPRLLAFVEALTICV